jgi:hypothetical protein
VNERRLRLLTTGALLCGGWCPAQDHLIARDQAEARHLATIIPGLYYSAACDSDIELRNLAQRAIVVEVAGYRSDGSLTALEDSPVNRIQLAAGQRKKVRLAVQSDEAWAEILEISNAHSSLAISANTSCRDGTGLRTVPRPVAYPLASPSFQMDFEQAPHDGSQLLVLNPTESGIQFAACYSGGHLISNDKGEMVPLCSESYDTALAPFHSTRLDLEREGRVLVRLRTAGDAVVLQMLKPAALQLNLFRVDSTIRFDAPAH